MSKIYRHNDIGIVGARLVHDENRELSLNNTPEDCQFKDHFCQAVATNCLLIRKKDFNAINGFDTIYYGDNDLCLKVNKNLGKKILYAANAIVFCAENVIQEEYRVAGKVQENIAHQCDVSRNIYNVDVSFITCVNNLTQYRNYIVGSLFMNETKKNYEIIPIMNYGNPYSAAQALNIGIEKARANIVVLCHQDVLFYNNWIDLLFNRINEIEIKNKNWGVIGTAGITPKDETLGIVYNIKGKLQWNSTKGKTVYPVQVVDEHCMVIRKDSGLKFDEKTFNGFHFYGSDLCLTALSKNMQNYGILCPLVHDSASGSMSSGRREFMRFLNALANKWRGKFNHIRTPTSVIRKRSIETFIKFKK